ncbi:MAG: GDSL-type esterase/lipase family protein [Candidatus Bathyarchaeota archaeon]|nr:GDSL-type esterase/lipase family protein [Candidatus Bathyarchaeota archaeon]
MTISLLIILLSSGIAIYLILSTSNRPNHKTIRIACVGDSLTQSSGYPYELWTLLGRSGPYVMGNYSIGPYGDNSTLSDSKHFAVGNFGAGSTTVLLNTETPYMNTSMFQNALEFQPNIVVIMLGTNDAQPNLEVYNASFVGDYVKLIAAFQALASKPDIWVVLPPPVLSNQSGPGRIDPQYLDSTIIPGIEQAAKEASVPIVDVHAAFAGHSDYFRDGVHVNSAGAKLIADEVYKAIISTNSW